MAYSGTCRADLFHPRHDDVGAALGVETILHESCLFSGHPSDSGVGDIELRLHDRLSPYRYGETKASCSSLEEKRLCTSSGRR